MISLKAILKEPKDGMGSGENRIQVKISLSQANMIGNIVKISCEGIELSYAVPKGLNLIDEQKKKYCRWFQRNKSSARPFH